MNWSSKLLSMGAKIVLIESILSSLPVYLLYIFKPPKGVIVQIEKLFSNFLWRQLEYGLRYYWVAWEKMCSSTNVGEVGFRSLQTVVDAFACRL